MSRIVTLPEDLYRKAVEFAANDHITVDEFVSIILKNRFASREYIEAKAKLFNREEFEQALNEIPDVEPDDCDRI